jgi:6-phosphogluconate dehydrogenase (decarboxylating)
MKKAFTAGQRGFHIAQMMGFEDESEAEDIVSSRRELYNRDNIEATPAVIQSLQSTIRRQEIIIEKSEAAYHDVLREVAQVREQNERLVQEIDQG